MDKKTIYDYRGGWGRLDRQLAFNDYAFVHLLFFRILVIVAIATFAVFAAGLFFQVLVAYTRYLIIAVWVLFTPQLFEVVKGLAMIGSGGVEYGHLDSSFLFTKHESEAARIEYKVLPYIVLSFWIGGLATLIFMWFL